MTTNADNDPAPGMTGQVITHNLPSYNEKNDVQGVEDAAELPFGNDAPEAEDEERRTSNQTSSWSLFNFNFIRCNKIILGSGIGVVLLLFVTWISSAALTSSNNSMVVESFNGAAAFEPDSEPTPAPTSAKASKSKSGKSECVVGIPNDGSVPTTCDECCDCPTGTGKFQFCGTTIVFPDTTALKCRCDVPGCIMNNFAGAPPTTCDDCCDCPSNLPNQGCDPENPAFCTCRS